MNTFAYYFSRLFVIAYSIFLLLVFISVNKWANWVLDPKKYEDENEKENKKEEKPSRVKSSS